MFIALGGMGGGFFPTVSADENFRRSLPGKVENCPLLNFVPPGQP